jgi:hypothetical protein
MHDPFFKSPVTVETTNAGDFLTLVSVAEAAIFLIERWPDEHGPRYRAALQACTSGLATAELVEDARRAFLAAAGEAGLRVKDEDEDEDLTPRIRDQRVPLARLDERRRNRGRMEEEEEFLVCLLARETGIRAG